MTTFNKSLLDSIMEGEDKVVLIDLYYYDLDETYPQTLKALRIASRSCTFPASPGTHPIHGYANDILTLELYANMVYDPVLVEVPVISKSLEGGTTIGNIVIDNSEGYFDTMLNYKFQYFSIYLTDVQTLYSVDSVINIIPIIYLGKVEGVSSVTPLKATLLVNDLREVYAKRKLDRRYCDNDTINCANDTDKLVRNILIGDVYNIPTEFFRDTNTAQGYFRYAQTLPDKTPAADTDDIVLKLGGSETAISKGASYTERVKFYLPSGYWKLDETSGTTMQDQSPYERHGTYTGTYTLNQTGTTTAPGEPNKSVLFNNGYGRVTTSNPYYIPTLVTIIIYVKTTTASGTFVEIGDGTNTLASINIQAGGFAGFVVAGTLFTSTTVINDGVFHQLAVTIQKDAAYGYVDGAKVISKIGNGTDYTLTTQLDPNVTVGANYNLTSYCNATIDEVVVYESVLSQSHITGLNNLTTDSSLYALTTEACDNTPGSDTIAAEYYGALSYNGPFESSKHTLDIRNYDYDTDDALTRLGDIADIPVNTSTAYPVSYEVAYLATMRQTFGQVLEDILRSTGGYWLLNDSQEVIINQMVDPSTNDAHFDIYQDEAVKLKVTNVEPPVRELNLKYGKNWSVMSEDELNQGEGQITDEEKTRLTTEWSEYKVTNDLPEFPGVLGFDFEDSNEEFDKEVETYLVDAGDVALEATRRKNLRSKYRKIGSLTVRLRGCFDNPTTPSAADYRWINVGDIVTIYHEKYGIDATKALVIGLTMKPTKGLLDLEVWW